MKKIHYSEAAAPFFEQLTKHGVFLTTNDKKLNTMTIGWASIGFYWGKPVITSMVRESRYTFPAITNKQEFTISVPTDASLKKALGICGTLSGRDCDKFDKAGISAVSSIHLGTPVIAECGLHFECRVLLTQPMPSGEAYGALPAGVDTQWYPTKDYHNMFVGEILAAYYSK